MQPYFFPYIGYFQLMASVDEFVVYDNIKYTKKGWINRNRFLLNNSDSVFSLPLKKDSDFLSVRERTLSEGYSRTDFLNKIKGAYSHAPYFDTSFPLLCDIIRYPDNNLFEYILNSLISLRDYLGLSCQLRVSSSIDIDHSLRAQSKVIALCSALNATTYINPPGGRDLYDTKEFSLNGLDLRFLQPNIVEYPQFGGQFIPWLSIIDVVMFNDVKETNRLITTGYELN